MAEAKAEKVKCANCGAEVRPDTQFCYSCGKSVATPEPIDEIDASDESLKALEAALAASRIEEPKSKIESAAAKRRQSRVSSRKAPDVVWEPAGPGVAYYIAAAVIFIFVLLIVLLSRAAR